MLSVIFLFIVSYAGQIKDDAKNGTYVENLTAEYVDSYEDVAQILMKVLFKRSKLGTL